MKKKISLTASFILIGLVAQFLAFGNNSNLNAAGFPNPSNDQGKKKGHDKDKEHHENDDHHKNEHHSNGNSNNSSLTIKIDLGKELKHQTGRNKDEEHDEHHSNNKNKHFDENHPSYYGQQRAAEARNKHKHFKPKKEKEAFEGIQIIITRNNFLLIETKQKISLARKRNKLKRESGEITLQAYNSNLLLIDSCEKRRVSLELKMSL